MNRLVLTLMMLAVPSALALPSETWVVSIGNNSGKMSETGLLYAEHDAVELAEALRLHSGVSSAQIRTMLGLDAGKVRQQLLDLNVQLREHLQPGAHTALVVFFLRSRRRNLASPGRH